MLSPKVWSFPAPRTKRSVQLHAEPSDVASAARSHQYYHCISIVCPDEYKLPDAILDAVDGDKVFYRLPRVLPTEFINKNFIEHFIYHGSIACLSINRSYDVGNCISINENGILILHVLDKLYQELGLEGKRSQENLYEILVDLKSEKLKCNKYHRKLKDGLQKLGALDIIIKWQPHEKNICPSSLAKYFYGENIDVSVSENRVSSTRRDVKQVPRWCDESVSDLAEWVGMVATGADLHPAEPYVSCYLPPPGDQDAVASQASLLMLHGFFTPKDILALYDEMKKYSESRDELHWTALSFHSFAEGPLGRATSNINHFQKSDSTYTIFIKQRKESIYKSLLIK